VLLEALLEHPVERLQALSNPYTGVLAIFASRLLNSRPPLIFEDGEQRRDFVSGVIRVLWQGGWASIVCSHGSL